MSRQCDLLVDCVITSSMDISNILATLPMDTRIVAIIKSKDSDYMIYRLENLRFKDVDPWDTLPRVNITTDSHTYWVEKKDLPMDNTPTSTTQFVSGGVLNYGVGTATQSLHNKTLTNTSNTCIHSWTMYQGLINHYEYCEQCGDKK